MWALLQVGRNDEAFGRFYLWRVPVVFVSYSPSQVSSRVIRYFHSDDYLYFVQRELLVGVRQRQPFRVHT